MSRFIVIVTLLRGISPQKRLYTGCVCITGLQGWESMWKNTFFVIPWLYNKKKTGKREELLHLIEKPTVSLTMPDIWRWSMRSPNLRFYGLYDPRMQKQPYAVWRTFSGSLEHQRYWLRTRAAPSHAKVSTPFAKEIRWDIFWTPWQHQRSGGTPQSDNFRCTAYVNSRKIQVGR